MKYQILVSYSGRNEPVDVADSLEEFERTYIWDLRWRITTTIFGAHRVHFRDEYSYQFYVKLIFGNDLLEDYHTLESSDITHLSVVTAVLKMPGGGVYQVLINYNDKKTELLDVEDSFEEFNKTTIRELKRKFRCSVPGAPHPMHIRLIFGVDLLEDSHTLGFYKLSHFSVLMAVMRMPGGAEERGGDKGRYQVLINYYDKKGIPLDVADSSEEFENTTVLELKEKLNEKFPETRVSYPNSMELIFGNERLEDHHTLGSYRITPSSLLFSLLRMPGGGIGLPPPAEIIPRSESMDRLMLNM